MTHRYSLITFVAIAAAFIGFVFSSTSVQAATLISTVDFESSKTTSELLKRGKDCTHDCFAIHNGPETYDQAFQLVSNISRAGKQAARLAIDSRIPYPLNKPRVDLAMVGDYRAVHPGDDMWMGYSVYYPESHIFANGGKDQTWGPQLSEIQGTGAAYTKPCGGGGGPISLNEFGDSFALKTRWSGTLNDCQNNIYKHKTFPSVAKIKKGAWNDLVFHYRLCADTSHGCTPKTEMWVNGQQVVNYTGPVGDAAMESQLFYKFDIAYYAHHETKDAYVRPKGVYYIYVDEIRIAKGPDGYALVDPSKSGKVPTGIGFDTGGPTRGGSSSGGTASTPAAKFTIGDKVQVSETVVVRSAAAGTWVSAQNTGAQGTIIGGPVTKALPDGTSYTWWQINYNTGKDGWSAEPFLFKSGTSLSSGNTSSGATGAIGSNSQAQLSGSTNPASAQTTTPKTTTKPVTTTTPTSASAGKFQAGDRVRTTENLNVRNAPVSNVMGSVLSTQPLGTEGTVIGGPLHSVSLSGNDLTWWQINYDGGTDGWSYERYLDKVRGGADTSVSQGTAPISLANTNTLTGHSNNFNATLPPSNLFDGCTDETSTCTTVAPASSVYVDFDFGTLYNLSQAKLFGDDTNNWFSTSWTLEYKEKATDPWQTAFSKSNAFTSSWLTKNLSNVTARYARVTVYGNVSRETTQVRELQIFGAKLGDDAAGAGTNSQAQSNSTQAPPPAPTPNSNSTPGLNQTFQPSQSSAGKFQIGDKVQVSETVVVRSAAAGTWVSAQNTGAQGTIIGGPVVKALPDGTSYTWWQINYNTGKDGWSAEPFLFKSGTSLSSGNTSSGATGNIQTNAGPPPSGGGKATLISTVDFESSNTTKELLSRGKTCEHDCLVEQTATKTYPQAFQLVSNVARAGNHSAKLSVDSRITSYPENKPRVDLAFPGDYRAVYPGEDMWIGYSVYYPTSHVFATGGSVSDWGPQLSEVQVYGSAATTPCGHGGGPLSLNEYNDTFVFKTRWSGTLADCQNKVYKRESYNLGKIQKGVWTDFVFHYRLCADVSHGCTPKIEVWKNGAQVLNSTDLIGDAAVEDKMFYKIDIAYYAHHELQNTYVRPKGIYSIYVDEIRFAKGPDGYALVDPSGR